MQKNDLKSIILSILEDKEIYQEGIGVYFIDILDKLREYSIIKKNISKEDYKKIIRKVQDILRELEDKNLVEERFFTESKYRGIVAYEKY